MNLAIDTNRYTDFCRGHPDVVKVLEQASSVYIPLIVLAELRAGFKASARPQENETILLRFLHKPGVRILSPDDDTTRVYAELYLYLRQQATPFPTTTSGSLLWSSSTASHYIPATPISTDCRSFHAFD
jgi:predicted nucleic acid-binding protein